MIRLGLCCTFRDEPIRFLTTTARALGTLPRTEGLGKLSGLCLANASALLAALRYCQRHGIGCFRVNSQILPLKTHPQHGYAVPELPDADAVVEGFRTCGRFAREAALRLSFHPDQFVVLNSPREDVVRASLAELEYQAEVAEWVGADVINIHGGGSYGDKHAALGRFVLALGQLSPRARSRLTVENDDKVFTPADLLPVCRETGLPLVYDVHHHRCNADGSSVEETTGLARSTWPREPLFHVSSPADGWDSARTAPHHDFIDGSDFPDCWKGFDLTVEVEAKAKEVAVGRLGKELVRRGFAVGVPGTGRTTRRGK